MGLIDGKIAVVTGGSGSIARGIATKLRKEGAIVVLIDADRAALDPAVAAVGGEGELADLTDIGAARRTFDILAARYGGIDIVVNAGQAITPVRRFAEKDPGDLGAAFSRSVMVATCAMQAAYPHLRNREEARVVNVGSFYGAMSNLGIADAVMADGALAGLTRAVAMEWAHERIFVNYLQPGAADIPEFRAFRDGDPERVDRYVGSLAIPRLADPVEDIGGAVMLLVSDEGNWLAGIKVFADGGQFINPAVFNPGADLVDFTN